MSSLCFKPLVSNILEQKILKERHQEIFCSAVKICLVGNKSLVLLTKTLYWDNLNKLGTCIDPKEFLIIVDLGTKPTHFYSNVTCLMNKLKPFHNHPKTHG